MKFMKSFLIFLTLLMLNRKTLAKDQELIIGLGRQISIAVPQKTKIQISNKPILRIKDYGQHLEIFGKKKGKTYLHVGSKTYQITVLNNAQWEGYQILKDVSQAMQGLEVSVLNQEVTLRGTLVRLKDWIKIASHFNHSQAQWSFQAQIDKELTNQVQQYFYQILLSKGLEPLTVNLNQYPQVFISKENEKLAPLYRKIFLPYGITVIIHKDQIALKPMIRVKILASEIKKVEMHQLGIQYPGRYQLQILDNSNIHAKDFDLYLQALETQGEAKILASPVILCRSGEEAQFLAGGEIPIKMMNFKTQNIVWKHYGVILKIKPFADYTGKMKIDLLTEVSSPDNSQKAQDVPGFFTHRIQSHFNLQQSETIALSGLIKHEKSVNKDGIPFLMNIPIIGDLFASKSFRQEKSELVFFVTPEVLSKETDIRNLPLNYEDLVYEFSSI